MTDKSLPPNIQNALNALIKSLNSTDSESIDLAESEVADYAVSSKVYHALLGLLQSLSSDPAPAPPTDTLRAVREPLDRLIDRFPPA